MLDLVQPCVAGWRGPSLVASLIRLGSELLFAAMMMLALAQLMHS